jgi:hypothetical protein
MTPTAGLGLRPKPTVGSTAHLKLVQRPRVEPILKPTVGSTAHG